MSVVDVVTRRRSPEREPVGGETLPLDREYWLAHCEGYHVDSPGGRVGLVEEVRRAEGSEQPQSLAVLAGMYGRRRLIFPMSEVETIGCTTASLSSWSRRRVVSARMPRDASSSALRAVEWRSQPKWPQYCTRRSMSWPFGR